MPANSTDKFKHAVPVKEADIDELGHVNNVVYLRWVQEVAAAHWQKVAPEQMKQEYSWVVLRHEIDYYRPAFLEDSIEGYTWVGEHQGPKIIRFVSLYKADSQQLLAEAKTTWCLLDSKSMRPRRISEEVAGIFKSPSGEDDNQAY